MPESSRAVVERYGRALAANDLDGQMALLHDDAVSEYPQSGERVAGVANHRAIVENYPGAERRALSADVERVVGADDEYMVGPSYNLVHIAGSGDEFVVVSTVTYPNGETWYMIQLIRVRDGRIWRATNYFGAPFEPPAWRAAYVEMSGDPTDS